MNERYSRQESFIGIDKLKEVKVAVVGCGAGGSQEAELLVRCGVGEIYLFDDDKVELHNLTGQRFTEKDVGRAKVTCLMNYLQSINSDVKIYANNIRIVKEGQLPKDLDYLFSCVDTFKARITLVNYQKRVNTRCIILDGGTSDVSTTIGTVQMYNREKGHITELKHFHNDLQEKLKTEEVMACTDDIIPSLITTGLMVSTIKVHMMLQHLKEGRIYEDMCQISLGKKPAIDWFEKAKPKEKKKKDGKSKV